MENMNKTACVCVRVCIAWAHFLVVAAVATALAAAAALVAFCGHLPKNLTADQHFV